MEFGCFVIFANEVIHELPYQLKGGLDLNQSPLLIWGSECELSLVWLGGSVV